MATATTVPTTLDAAYDALQKSLAEIDSLLEEAREAQASYEFSKDSGPEWTRFDGQVQGLMMARRIVGNLFSYGEVIE
jgi:hypothetical protein